MKTVALTLSSTQDSLYLRTRYVRYILSVAEQSGFSVLPVLLPLTNVPSLIEAYAHAFDGYLFTGGEDVHPSFYGEAVLDCCGTIEPARDGFELALLKRLIEADRPVLGICRGCQVMNVALGGTLWQDRSLMRPPSPSHTIENKAGIPSHGVRTDGFVRTLSGEGQIIVNSYHHQSVKALGEGLRVCARAEDGTVEAIDHGSLRYYRAVQWHPEICPDALSYRLLGDFFRYL